MTSIHPFIPLSYKPLPSLSDKYVPYASPSNTPNKPLFYPSNCKIENCVDQFKIPLPLSESWVIMNKLSWDDIISGVFFIFNFVILILSTVYIVKQLNKKLEKKEEDDIILTQKILRLILGVVSILIGIYHLYIFTNKVGYSIQNRAFIGSIQILTGVLFIIFSSYSLSKK